MQQSGSGCALHSDAVLSSEFLDEIGTLGTLAVVHPALLSILVLQETLTDFAMRIDTT